MKKAFDTKKIKITGVPRYFDERVSVRREALEHLKDPKVCVEVYAGMGSMRSEVYGDTFSMYYNNDLDKVCPTLFHLPAMDFIKEQLSGFPYKIDLIDFDAYGGPHFEIQKFFELRKNKDCPIIVVVTDGIGITLKRSQKMSRPVERFMLGDNTSVDLKHCWRNMKEMTFILMTEIAKKYDMKLTPIAAIPGKGRNFLFSAWLFENK